MKARDERLRQLLRDADPARTAPELGADEVARLRRAVVGGVEHATFPWWARPGFAFALAAAVAIVVLGLALWRFETPREPVPSDRRTAASPATPLPRDRNAVQPVPDRVASARPSARQPAGTRRGVPATPAIGRDTARRPSPSRRPTQSPPQPVAPPAASTPTETVAAAVPASEPQQPYQLQLTAPGGTRIVWLLTSPSGR